jgi:pimeloyl-ACP methyl ester carboxylesterase
VDTESENRSGDDRSNSPERQQADANQMGEEITLHGHRVSFRRAGWGPVVVLIHGVAGSSATWDPVIEPLADRYTVVAPDLVGHGESAKPRGDYSLGAFASGIRDLLQAIGHERATIVGHSLGGGVAMQLAYQFPERCERLVLVSSGGLGREVNFLLRAATLPGSEWVIPLLASNRVLGAGDWIGRLVGRAGLRAGSDLEEIWRSLGSLHDAGARQAFVYTLRSMVDPGGQRVSARDRLYLAKEMPTLIVWGGSDRIIPAHHGREAHEAMPGSRFETFQNAGHFPHRDDPLRFVRTLDDFIRSTEPAKVTEERMRDLLREGE